MNEAKDKSKDKDKGGSLGGYAETEHYVMDVVRDTATDTVHVARDVAAETIRAVGEVGEVTVRSASGILIGVAQGLRDIAGTLSRGRDEPRV